MAQRKASKDQCLACLENGWNHSYHGRDCREYIANRRGAAQMLRLFAKAPDWRTAPLPGPSPDFPLVSAYSGDQARGFDIKPDPDKRELYRLLASDGAAYKAFRKAVLKAEAARERETTTEAA